MRKTFIKGLGASLVAVALVFLGITAPAYASTGTLSVTTFTKNTQTPPMVATSSQPSGTFADIRVLIQQPTGSNPYFSLKGSCPVTSSANLSLCGINSVTVGSIDKSSTASVVNDGSGYLKISFSPAVSAGAISVDFAAGAFSVNPSLGNYDFILEARSAGATVLGTYTQSVTVVNGNSTVTFDGNGADGGSTPSQTASVTTALTPNGFTKTGYNFAGWNTSANGSGTPYIDGANYSFAYNRTLYAQWTAASGSGAGSSGTSDTLASTGFDAAPYLSTGAVLALAGAVLILFARRRQTS